MVAKFKKEKLFAHLFRAEKMCKFLMCLIILMGLEHTSEHTYKKWFISWNFEKNEPVTNSIENLNKVVNSLQFLHHIWLFHFFAP